MGVFQGTLRLEVIADVKTVQSTARRVSGAVRDQLKEELARLEQLGVIIRQDEPTDWVSPIVVARKKNGQLRICIDRQDLNRYLRRQPHPVPTVEELLPEVRNARVFSKCDVRNGFWHIRLDESSSRLLTFATPFGRYRWTRMPFGISPVPEIFQRWLEQQLIGLDGVSNIHDDILVIGEGNDLEEAVRNHDQRMDKLLQRCAE